MVAVAVAPPWYASCSADAGRSGSPVVFAGTVDATRGGFTRFAVDEVWAGPDLAPEVWLLTGQRGSGVSSSVDADLGAPVRPSHVRSPTAAGSDGADPPTSAAEWLARMVGVVAGGFLVLRAVLALADRRRLA